MRAARWLGIGGGLAWWLAGAAAAPGPFTFLIDDVRFEP
jgi:hypothetical protein